jgi:hypothetical protein
VGVEESLECCVQEEAGWPRDEVHSLRSVLHSLFLQQKRKLRLYISNTFNPAKPDAEDSDGSIASWELRVEGKLLDDVRPGPGLSRCPGVGMG